MSFFSSSHANFQLWWCPFNDNNEHAWCTAVRNDHLVYDCASVLATRTIRVTVTQSEDATITGRQSEGSIIRGFVNQKWVPYSQRYLCNAIPDTNHNANPTNPNRYSKGNRNPTNPTNPTNPNTRYRITEPSDYWTLGLSIHYRCDSATACRDMGVARIFAVGVLSYTVPFWSLINFISQIENTFGFCFYKLRQKNCKL